MAVAPPPCRRTRAGRGCSRAWPSSETLYRSSNFDSQVGRKWRGDFGVLPPPLAVDLGFTRDRPPYRPAEVGNIRLRLEGWGGGMIARIFLPAPTLSLPRKRGRERWSHESIRDAVEETHASSRSSHRLRRRHPGRDAAAAISDTPEIRR